MSGAAPATTAATAAPAAAVAGPGSVPRLGAGLRLQWEEAQQCRVLLYPEGMVRLNQSAGEIMARCDGVCDVAAIVADLEAAFAVQGLERDVLGFIDLALHKQWLRLS